MKGEKKDFEAEENGIDLEEKGKVDEERQMRFVRCKSNDL